MGEMPDDEMLQPRFYRDDDGDAYRTLLSICPEDETLNELLSGYRIEGTPALAFELERKPNQGILIKAHAELNGLVSVLASSGMSGAEIHFRRPPMADFQLATQDANVYVEFSEVRQHAKIFAALRSAQAVVSERLQEAGTFGGAGYVSIAFHRLPGGKELEPFLRHLTEWLLSTKWSRNDDYAIPDDLARFVGRASIRRLPTDELVSFALLGNAHPHIVLPSLLALIDQKKRKRYVGRPLWLAIHAHAGFDSALHQLRNMNVSTGQFERIMVFDGQDALTIERSREFGST